MPTCLQQFRAICTKIERRPGDGVAKRIAEARDARSGADLPVKICLQSIVLVI